MESTKGKNRADERRRELAQGVRGDTIEDFQERMAAAGVTRTFVVYENGEFNLSHPKLLEPVQAFLELSHDFARHEGIFIGREEGIPSLFFAFVHDTRRGLSQGGLRFTRYSTLGEVVTDGIRLAQGMARKNALAGLWWGGGKGIVTLPARYERPEHMTDPEERGRLFEAYGRFVASLGGIYYTAEDVGTKTADLDAVLRQNRFVTCISRTLGGSGNPSAHTARGVYLAMQAAWLFLDKTDRLAGVKVAVQGAGNVGAPLIELLDDAGAEVSVCDVNEAALEAMVQRRPRVRIVPTDQIFDLAVDVFAPCARGAQVNQRTIPRLAAARVKLICGAANNILEEPADAERLRQAGILFVPDYVCNRMGITNCADEWMGYLEEDVRLAAERVYPDTLRVLKHAQQLGVTTVQAADELADIAASELHPLLGHRGRRIIDHLIASGWHDGDKKRRKDTGARATLEPAFVPALDEPHIRVGWEKEGRFRGSGRSVAASPISAASRPNLASFFSPVLMDVRARALELLDGERPRRVAGSDHGGLALQLAVEWSLPYERQTVGRPEFVELCRDFHVRNDAAVREQLHQLGVGFDPQAWLDPMEERVGPTIDRLFYTLLDAGLIVRENRLALRCPRCESVLVASDVKRERPPGAKEPVLRCGRCETMVEPDSSPQLFVHLDRAIELLRQAIANGSVRFNADHWRDRVLGYLETMEPWCISRQYWWGNEIPSQREEVLSTWFSLAAWSLQGMGWPAVAAPDPIDEVFADPDWLLRWVVPSQLLALAVTGRPAFRRVHVHGAVHVLDRKLAERPEVAAGAPDEERYLFRVVHRPMRRGLGNVVEPGTLVRRFGADALRLGYLLVDDAGSSEVVTLAESHLRRARRAVHSLVSKVTGLFGMVREPLHTGPRRPEDDQIVADCAAAGEAARRAYAEHRYATAAERLVETIEAFARYANSAAERRQASTDLGAVRAATVAAIGEMRTAFSPICPYLFEKLDRWARERCPAVELPLPEEPVADGRELESITQG